MNEEVQPTEDFITPILYDLTGSTPHANLATSLAYKRLSSLIADRERKAAVDALKRIGENDYYGKDSIYIRRAEVKNLIAEYERGEL